MTQSRLLNSCSWSSSRESTFSECKKKYWYTYYGSWDGWPIYYNDPRGTKVDPLAEYLYMLKNMQPLVVYVGSVVHKVIETVLRSLSGKSSRALPPLETILKEGTRLFYKGIDESEKLLWKKHPKKHTHILEHFYQHPLDAAAIKEAEEKVKKCLENWHSSPCVQNIILNQRASWGEIEKAMNFTLEEGVQAIVVFDFSLHWQRLKNDQPPLLMIFDWKTGQDNQKIEEQLYAYALSAKKVLNASYDSMILVPFFLMEGPNGYRKVGADQIDTIDEVKLESIRKKIIASSKEMLQVHETRLDEKGASIKPDPRLFPYTEQKAKCRRCPFLAMCERAEYRDLTEEELRITVCQ